MKTSKNIRLGFIFILIGIVGDAVTGALLASAANETFMVAAYCFLILILCGFGIVLVYSMGLSRDLKDFKGRLEQKRLELATYIGNMTSEYLVERNSSFTIEEKKLFFPIFIRYVPRGISVILARKEGRSDEMEKTIMVIVVNLSDKIGGSPEFSLGIIRDIPENYFSLTRIDSLLDEAHRIIKSYQIPKE